MNGKTNKIWRFKLAMRPSVMIPRVTTILRSATGVTIACMALLACSSRPASGIQVNSKPTAPYDLTAAIKNPPGEFDRVEAKAFYEVQNPACAPITSVSGVRNAPRHTISLPVAKTGDSFHATFFADALVDGDYYGQGICHWRLTSVGVSVVRKSRRFDASVSPPAPHQQSITAPYFSIESYEDSSQSLIDTGLRDKSELTHPDKAFQIELTTSAVMP